METRNIQDYTNLCIAHAKANGIELTHLKLQKVLYYLQAWSLACLDDHLFADEPQAWVNGPVYRSVYDRFQGLGAEPIVTGGCVREADAEELRQTLIALGLSAPAEELLAEVLEDYMPKSAGELVYRTHQERPWREARRGLRPFESGNVTIRHEVMRHYYRGLLSQQKQRHKAGSVVGRHFPTAPGGERRSNDAIGYRKLSRDDYDDLADVDANFWYYDLSHHGGTYCFDNPQISLFDYQCYFEVMRELSDYRIGELLRGNASDDFLRKHSFHEVTVGKYPNLQRALQEHFNLDKLPGGIDCPLIYQIGLYNSDKCVEVAPARKKAPRVFFRLTDRGAFSVFFLDLYHDLCPQADRSS